MARVEQGSQKYGTKESNEDFSFTYELPQHQGWLLVVGDFARADSLDVDEVAKDALERALKQAAPTLDNATFTLVLLAGHLNTALLDYQKGWQKQLQCCAVFAQISGNKLFYLPIGDCRIAVQRGDTLMLLHGSIWDDGSSARVIRRGDELRRSHDAPPEAALGIGALPPSLLAVRDFTLERDDVVLLYSDGVDKVISPARLLELAFHAQTPEELVKRTLTEVENNRGDDDRTILVAYGPHRSFEGATQARELEGAWAEIRQQKQVVEELGAAINNQHLHASESLAKSVQRHNEVIHQQFTTLEEKLEEGKSELKEEAKLLWQNLPNQLQQIETQQQQTKAQLEILVTKVQQLRPPPTNEEIAALLNHKLKTVSETEQVLVNQLPVIQSTLLRVEAALSQLKIPSPHASVRHVEPEAVVPTAEAPRQSVNPPASFIRYSPKLPATDGVLLVTANRFQLVDASEAEQNPKGKNPSTLCFVASDVRPGWLIVSYLYCLHQYQKSALSGYKTADGMFDWINENQPDWSRINLETLTPNVNEYRELRQNHRWLHVNPPDEQFLNHERECARKLCEAMSGSPPKPEGASTDSTSNPLSHVANAKQWWNRLSNRRRLALGMVVVIAALFALGIWYFGFPPFSTTPSLTNQTTATDAQKITFAYGGDGRHILLATEGVLEPKPINFWVQTGDEEKFKAMVVDFKLGSESEAELFLRRRASLMVVDDSRLLKQQLGLTLYFVKDEGMEQSCNAWLRLISQTVRPTTLEELQKLNPGMRCENLKAGDVLVVPDNLRGR